MKNYRLIGVVSILVMLAGCGVAAVFYGREHTAEVHDSYASALPKAPKEEDPLGDINDDFTVKDSFASHLPIVVLDTNGVEPPVNTYFDEDHENSEEGLYVPIEGLDPYVDGTISIYSREEGANTVWDEPVLQSNIRIKRRGNTSMGYEKAQWMVKLVTDSGQYKDVNVLGMGEDHNWILNGSMYDKSMLRNYLAYSIASEILPYTPDSRYCEVLLKDGDTYTYQGVYLLMENIAQGTDRVAIAEYHENDTFHSYLVRRDRYDEEALTIENYGRLNGYSTEYLALLYPAKDRASERMVSYVNEDISYIESILYAEDEDTFSAYADVIDVDSFIDYFLINEYFGNYDAGNNSTYFYKDVGGRLSMGPVWDFDGAMDNYMYEPLETDNLAFNTKPWFDCLCTDLEFVKKLQARYTGLRQGPLSDAHVIGKIDEIIDYLGGAREREWARWGHWYTTENEYSLQEYVTKDGMVLQRNAVTYEDEIVRIKTVLREHGDSVADDLRVLENSTARNTGFDSWMGYLLLLAAAVFFIPAVFVSLKK